LEGLVRTLLSVFSAEVGHGISHQEGRLHAGAFRIQRPQEELSSIASARTRSAKWIGDDARRTVRALVERHRGDADDVVAPMICFHVAQSVADRASQAAYGA